MKKLFFALCAMLLAMSAAAGDYYQFKNFVLNQDEEVVVVREMPTSLDFAAFQKKIERNLCGDDGTMDETSVDGDLHVYSVQFQADAYYNPFAGTTQRILEFTMEVSIENGVATIVMYKMKVEERYVGYGMKTQFFNITNKIMDYNDALAVMADKKNHTKAERNDAEDTLDDVEKVLSGSDEELGKRLDKLAKAVK